MATSFEKITNDRYNSVLKSITFIIMKFQWTYQP